MAQMVYGDDMKIIVYRILRAGTASGDVQGGTVVFVLCVNTHMSFAPARRAEESAMTPSLCRCYVRSGRLRGAGTPARRRMRFLSSVIGQLGKNAIFCKGAYPDSFSYWNS